jgi:hypothetical protein
MTVYKLTTTNGAMIKFYVRAVAECYQSCLGGVIVEENLPDQTSIDDNNSG